MSNTALRFDRAKVEEITGVAGSDGEVIRCLLQPHQVQDLVSLGVADPALSQNESPSIQEFLDIAIDLPTSSVNLQCYIVFPPRNDARVSVEGLIADRLTPKECIYLICKARHADELDVTENSNGSWRVSAWWD